MDYKIYTQNTAKQNQAACLILYLQQYCKPGGDSSLENLVA